MGTAQKAISTAATLLCCAALGLSACAQGPIVAREILADPTMRFAAGRPVEISAMGAVQRDEPNPANTVSARVVADTDPGNQVQGTWLESSLRVSAEIIEGVGLEAGYGITYRNQQVQKLDGFTGPIADSEQRHGPEAALVLNDGTSLLRAGYRYQSGWQGVLNEPSIRARTSVISRDTIVEVGYRRTMAQLKVPAERLPASIPSNDDFTSDRMFAAIEQGFLPGWSLRLDLAMILENGFLQSPYHLVSLWSERVDSDSTSSIPRVEAERHPSARVRWGTTFRVRRRIEAMNSALEFGLGHGAGSWRVEHSSGQLGYLQRLGDQFTLGLRGGLSHQTRASFYRDDYNDGPPGAYWSADRALSSQMAWWVESSAIWSIFAGDSRIIAIFKYLTMEAGLRLLRRDFMWEGADSNNGFTSYSSLVGDQRSRFEGGSQLGGWFGIVGGF